MVTNMLSLLMKFHKTLEENSPCEVIAFYTDFSKAFDKVTHKEFHEKPCQIGVQWCLYEILLDYLSLRKQFLRVDNTCCSVLEVTSGLPQGSLLGPLLFFILKFDLLDVLKFSNAYLFTDDIKIISVNRSYVQVQLDLDSIEYWLTKNKMSPAMLNCFQIIFRGIKTLFLQGAALEESDVIKDPKMLLNKNRN